MSTSFLIVTPHLNMGKFLPRCCQSLADQAGVARSHYIVDAGSTDGSLDWLANKDRNGTQETSESASVGRYDFRWISEPDQGMYDALNKGFSSGPADLLAWLNADEQYLPGTLAWVATYFDQHPDVDVLTGDALVTDDHGALLAYRKGQPLRRSYIQSAHLYAFSCTLFFRQRIWMAGLRFDPHWKSCGDADWIVQVLKAGYVARHVRRYLAVFTHHATNTSQQPSARREEQAWRAQQAAWCRWLRWPLNGLRLAEKLGFGAYCQCWPLDYAIYTGRETGQRTPCVADTGTWRWPAR